MKYRVRIHDDGAVVGWWAPGHNQDGWPIVPNRSDAVILPAVEAWQALDEIDENHAVTGLTGHLDAVLQTCRAHPGAGSPCPECAAIYADELARSAP